MILLNKTIYNIAASTIEGSVAQKMTINYTYGDPVDFIPTQISEIIDP